MICRVKERGRGDSVDQDGGFQNYGKGGRKRGGDAGKVCMSARGKGGVVYKERGWERRREKRERGKEKTRLPQHDLQIALSPWRLLSALSSIQSSGPNSGATI